jgi:hypothetical protein
LLFIVLELEIEHLREGHGSEIDLTQVFTSLFHDFLPVALLDSRDLEQLDQWQRILKSDDCGPELHEGSNALRVGELLLKLSDLLLFLLCTRD